VEHVYIVDWIRFERFLRCHHRLGRVPELGWGKIGSDGGVNTLTSSHGTQLVPHLPLWHHMPTESFWCLMIPAVISASLACAAYLCRKAAGVLLHIALVPAFGNPGTVITALSAAIEILVRISSDSLLLTPLVHTFDGSLVSPDYHISVTYCRGPCWHALCSALRRTWD